MGGRVGGRAVVVVVESQSRCGCAGRRRGGPARPPSPPVRSARLASPARRPAQVGGRSVVNRDITQYVELRPEEDRFLRLLEILGEW